MISKRSKNQKDLLANYKVEKTILVHALSCAPSDSVGRLVDVSQRERQRRVNNAPGLLSRLYTTRYYN